MDGLTVEDCFGRYASDETCPIRGILSFSPLIFLWLTLPLQYYKYTKVGKIKKKNRPKSSLLHLARIISFISLIICEGAILFWSTITHVAIERLALAAFNLLSYALALVLYIGLRRRGDRSNSCLSVTFLFLAVVQFIDVVVLLFERPIYEQAIPIEALLVMVQTALLGKADDVSEKIAQKKSPEEYCSFVSRLFLSWLDELVKRGAKTDLTVDDLYPLIPSAQSETLNAKWEQEWSRSCKSADETGKTPSIAWTIFHIYRNGWVGIMFLRITCDIVAFVNPVLLKYLIDFVADPDAPLSLGIGIALLMFTIAEVRSFILNFFLYTVIQYAVKIQAILSNAVYRKTLRLSTAARNRRTVGEIVNFMAIDIERLVLVLPFVHNFWSAPLQVTLAMVLLWFTLGPSAIGGIIIMASFIPINYYSSKYIKQCQISQMKIKDHRTKLCNEVLNGIKLIKLYAWEEPFENKINNLRKQEVKYLQRSALMTRVVDSANVAAPFLVAAVSFGTYVSLSEDNILTPQKAFVALALFNQIRQPMRIVAMFVTNLVQARVANKRLKAFLNDEDMQELKFDRATEGMAIEMENVSMNWLGPSSEAAISNMNLKIESASLTAVVGPVGAGKSSLLSAVLGEMYLMSGQVRITGSIAYAPQQPWLQNMTMRENITFGKKFDKKFYNKVVDACQLLPDFSLFPQGDLTEVGENGVTLSGGQKARLGLARAVYQDTEIYLLDDILAAVDAHVGAALFEKVIGTNGLLATKTRVLVTHGLQYTKTTDSIIVMKDGVIVQQGPFNELSSQEGLFSEMLKEYLQTKEDLQETEASTAEDDDVSSRKEKPKKRTRRISSLSDKETSKRITFAEPKLIKNEKLETGRVKSSVYWSFIQAATLRWSLSFFLLMILHYALQSVRSVWLSKWSDSAMHKGNDTLTVGDRLQVYTALGISEVAAVALAFILQTFAARAASLNLHGPLLRTILRTPMSFFDTTPTGRILNRLSRDIEVIDSQLPISFRNFVQYALQTIMVLVLISYSTPLFIIAIIPLGAVYFLLLHYFIPTSRQLKRLDSIKRSPILSTFGESIHGCVSIRAYNKIESTCDSFSQLVDSYTQCRHLSTAANRWLCLRLEILGNCIVMLSAFLGVLATRISSISPGLVGLSVTFALSITDQLNLTVRMLSDLETNIVSVERIKEYSDNDDLEMEWDSDCPPDFVWPDRGEIRFEEYAAQYRKNLPMVLKGVTASIKAREKVAVVGRTGSGKSSLTLALFRIIEPNEGRIIIDNIDVYNIGLHDLRAKITIIPQEPVLFSGSLRFNLDPFNKYTDEEHWSALEACQLREFVTSQHNGLDYEIAEGGSNMSVGQRQLVCLGRALLRKGKILVLDEATAAVDVATDSLVQEVIREKFSDATVIAIAHRLNTVANYDRIMVLERGRIAEFDTPQNLLRDENSRYSRMVEKSKTQ